MEKVVNILTYLFVIIFTFGIYSEGVQRKKIRRFGFIGFILMFFVGIILSIIKNNSYYFGLFVDVIYLFGISNLLMWILFRKILKINYK